MNIQPNVHIETMGCGRSKQIHTNLKFVKPYHENEQFDVIQSVNAGPLPTEMGFIGSCCQRIRSNNFKHSSNVDKDGCHFEEIHIKTVSDNLGDDIPTTHDQVSTIHTECAPYSIDLEDVEAIKCLSISSIDAINSLAESQHKRTTSLDDRMLLSNTANKPEIPNTSKMPPNFVYDDEDYQHVITEYAPEHLLKLVHEEFYPKDLNNLMAITGIGFQYMKQIYRKYPPEKDSDKQEVLLPTKNEDTLKGSLSNNNVASENSTLFPIDVKFIQESGSRSSGFISDTFSSNDSLECIKHNEVSPIRRKSCPSII